METFYLLRQLEASHAYFHNDHDLLKLSLALGNSSRQSRRIRNVVENITSVTLEFDDAPRALDDGGLEDLREKYGIFFKYTVNLRHIAVKGTFHPEIPRIIAHALIDAMGYAKFARAVGASISQDGRTFVSLNANEEIDDDDDETRASTLKGWIHSFQNVTFSMRYERTHMFDEGRMLNDVAAPAGSVATHTSTLRLAEIARLAIEPTDETCGLSAFIWNNIIDIGDSKLLDRKPHASYVRLAETIASCPRWTDLSLCISGVRETNDGLIFSRPNEFVDMYDALEILVAYAQRINILDVDPMRNGGPGTRADRVLRAPRPLVFRRFSPRLREMHVLHNNVSAKHLPPSIEILTYTNNVSGNPAVNDFTESFADASRFGELAKLRTPVMDVNDDNIIPVLDALSKKPNLYEVVLHVRVEDTTPVERRIQVMKSVAELRCEYVAVRDAVDAVQPDRMRTAETRVLSEFAKTFVEKNRSTICFTMSFDGILVSLAGGPGDDDVLATDVVRETDAERERKDSLRVINERIFQNRILHTVDMIETIAKFGTRVPGEVKWLFSKGQRVANVVASFAADVRHISYVKTRRAICNGVTSPIVVL